MNEKIKDIMNTISDSKILDRINKATENFTKQQKLTAGGVVGVFALAALLSVAPAVNFADMANAGAESVETRTVAVADADEEQWLISIGGKLVLAVGSEEEAAAVFEGVKSYYLTDKNNPDAEVTFDREFRWDAYNYKEAGGDPAWEMSVEEAIAYIISGTATPKTYVVQGGDTVWDIAAKNGISLDKLEEMNPGITGAKLQIGSTINLYEAKPFISVTTKENVVATESIPYETVYEETNSMYRGQSKVKTAGENGSKQTTTEIIKQNGIVVASTLLDETVLSEPKNQVSLKGTAAIPVYTGSQSLGVLANPMSHMEISSPYGASRGSRRHAGIDLRNPKGTPFAAAADGVVIYASYSGSYGNIIKIDHGGGLQTYYAHCDSMYVSVGETVKKGQTIGTVGSTGNATGNVLHFEVRINGVAQNPVNYL